MQIQSKSKFNHPTSTTTRLSKNMTGSANTKKIVFRYRKKAGQQSNSLNLKCRQLKCSPLIAYYITHLQVTQVEAA